MADNATSNQAPSLLDPFYPDPPWCKKTDDDWKLVEIKSGTILQTISLTSRPCWLLGRAADQVHIPLAHESISRCHARIAFDSNGTPWLRDCNSRHGVFVNKKRLPQEAIGVDESNSTKKGSRGVVLYPGDSIKFGASTRFYCLEGPDEFQRGRIQIVPKKQQKLVKPPPQETTSGGNKNEHQQEKKVEDDEFVSWGISMDDPAVEDDDTAEMAIQRQRALENGDAIPDKHRKAWEKIAALKYKLNNVQTESERIRRKGELTSGQEHQLQRNAEREKDLQGKILERERDLFEKLNPTNTNSKKRQYQATDEDDGLDDFFDRTKDNVKNGSTNRNEAESEESLMTKYVDIVEKLKARSLSVERMRQKVKRLQQRYNRLEAAGDDETFFAKNDFDLAEDQLKRMDTEISDMEKELEDTKRLLKIVNPRLSLNNEAATMAPPVGQKRLISTAVGAESIMPPPPSKISANTEQETKDVDNHQVTSTGVFMMPQPKRIKASGPSLLREAGGEEPEPTQRASTSSSSNNSVGKAKGPAIPPVGTLAAITAATRFDSKKQGASSSRQPTNKNKVANEKPAATIDLKRDEWQAPKDQDGSGITKLNAKFSGRY